MPLLVALVIKEMQTWLRGRLTFAVFGSVVLILCTLFVVLALRVLGPEANQPPPATQAPGTGNTVNAFIVTNRALLLFASMGLCVLLTSAAVAPAVAASAFAGERERGMMDLLLLQAPGPGRIVLGKVIAAFLFSLLVLLVSLPLFGPAWSFGGVSTEFMTMLGVVVLTSTLLFTAIGVFFSSMLLGVLSATIFAQGAALFFLFGLPGIYLVAQLAGAGEAVQPILWLNPFASVLSAGGNTSDALARAAPPAIRGLISLPTGAWVPGFTVPAWAIGSTLWTLIAVLLMAFSTVAIDPNHPWRLRRRA